MFILEYLNSIQINDLNDSNLSPFSHHKLIDLIMTNNPLTHRILHSKFVHLFLQTNKLNKPNNLLIVYRIGLEQANQTDLISDNHFNNFQSLNSLIPIRDLDNWSDLRWIPGWRHLINGLFEENIEGLVFSWNK